MLQPSDVADGHKGVGVRVTKSGTAALQRLSKGTHYIYKGNVYKDGTAALQRLSKGTLYTGACSPPGARTMLGMEIRVGRGRRPALCLRRRLGSGFMYRGEESSVGACIRVYSYCEGWACIRAWIRVWLGVSIRAWIRAGIGVWIEVRMSPPQA